MTGAVGLRERKKVECRRVIAAAARGLAIDRGVDGFTIDDVAERADISPRTFFNYFSTKEEAVIGLDPSRIAETARRLQARPRSESPLTALRRSFVDDNDDLEANAAGFAAMIELVHRHRQLMPSHLAATHELEERLIEAMATRLDVDPTLDPYPTIVVSVGVAALRSTTLWWHQNGRAGSLAGHIHDAFESLARGLRQSAK